MSISQVMLANECVRRPEAMFALAYSRSGRSWLSASSAAAPHLECFPAASRCGAARPRYTSDSPGTGRNEIDPLAAMDWVTLWALAVNEENASGGRWSPRRPAGGRHHPSCAALRGHVCARHRR